MALQNNLKRKYEKLYKELNPVIRPLLFAPNTPFFMREEWRPVLPCFVPGVIPGAYYISTYGNVYSTIKSPKYPNGGIMSHSINEKGYHQINLMSTDGKKIGIKITKLVMLHFAFFPECYLYEVDHLDGDKDNNCIWNFEWVSPIENTRRSIEYGKRSEYTNPDEQDISTQQAIMLYAYSLVAWNDTDFEVLSKEFNVPVSYIYKLRNGEIRPYIARKFGYLEKLLRTYPHTDDFLDDRWGYEIFAKPEYEQYY